MSKKTNLSNLAMRRAVALLVLGFSTLSMAPASAAVASFQATVTRTLATADDSFGGCMVALSVSPSDEGLMCPVDRRWVTLSCSGTHTTKANALRMMDSAQLAFVTGRPVQVWVNDAKKHNDYCFVERIDVLSR